MIKPEEIPTLYQKLKSHIARDFRPSAVTQNTIVGGGGATSFSGLTGTIANAQAPQFLLRDGTRSLTGNLAVDAGITIDGVDISAHAADPNAHHAQQHSITGGDHTVSGAALDIVGLTAPNALGILTPSSSPGAVSAILKSSAAGDLTLPTFTATTHVRTPLINTSSGNLTLTPAGSFVKLGTSKGIESAGTFVSGFTGSGLRIDDGITKASKTSMEADNLTIRGTMRVYELIIQQIRMTNGSLLVSSVGKVKAVSGSGPYTITTDGQHGFAVNDILLAQRWNPTAGALTGVYIFRSVLQVTSITTAGTDWQFTATLLDDDAPIEGAEYGRIGNTTDTNRQGGIYLTSDDSYAPYIDIYNDVDSLADWTGAAKLKARIGRLDGISDAVLNPTGYGLYSANAFLQGVVSAANDVVRLDSSGVRVKATTASAFASTNAYRLTNASGVEMGGVYGRDYTSAHTIGVQAIGDATHSALSALTSTGANASGAATTFIEARNSAGTKVSSVTVDVTNSASYILFGAADYAQFNMETRSSSGGHRPTVDLGANLGTASYRWGTAYAGTFNASSAITVGGTAVSLDGHTHSYLPLSGGTLTGTLTSRAITPSADNTYDLGASGARWQDLYAVNLHVNTIVGTPSYSHSHAASDITSGTLDFARIPTTWTGALTLDADSAGTSNYVRWLTQTTTGKGWDLTGRAHDYATVAQQNDLLLTYYDGTTIYTAFHADSATRIIDFGQTPTVGGTAVSLTGHTHDDRYFTETESDARYVQTATLSGYLLASGATVGATSQAQEFSNGAILVAPSTSASQLMMRSARAAIVTDNVIGGIDFQSNDTSLTAPGTVTARIQALANTTHTTSALGTDIVFSTTTGTTLSEAMRITGAGPVSLSFQPTADSHAITRGYSISKGMNLVTNGSGLLATNYNFSGFTFDAVETHGGGGSFKYTGAYTVKESDEYLPVDTGKYYRLVAWAKSGNADGSGFDAANKQGVGVTNYDIDKLRISPEHFMLFPGAALTTLAADLNTGATTITLTSASGWAASNASAYNRQMVWYPYTNGFGYSYPSYSYSRNTTYNSSTYPTYFSSGLWAVGGISGNTITLTTPWTGPNLPAGTSVANGSLGSTYKYVAMAFNTIVADAWSRYEGYIGTTDTNGGNVNDKFAPGTAYVRINFLCNITGTATTNVIRFSDIWFSEVSSRNLESASSTVPGVVALADQQLGTGVKWVPSRFGVGMSSAPATYTLDVNGTTRATGIIYASSDIEMTGELLAANGSASIPSIAALSDTNTGLYWSAADTLAITTGGTQRATFSGTGLSVTGTLVVSSTASVGDGSTTTPGLNFGADANTGIYRSGADAFSMVAGGTAIINIGATGASVNAAFDNTAALKVQSVANDDITLFLKQRSGQTARMWRVEDSGGQELIVLDSQGNLQSGNPGFYNGLTGWQITPNGNAEFNNITARGELHASIFVMDEFHASGGTLVVAPAGKLENDATVYTTNGVSQVIDLRTTSVSGSGSQLDIRTTSGSGSGTQLTVRWIQNYFDITDPPSGHAMVFSFGDTLRCKSLGDPGVGIDLYDIWGTVTLVEDMTDYYRYYYQRRSGGSNGIVIPAGTAIISYGAEGDGRILLTADQNYAPYIDIFTSGATPWTGDVVPHTRLGRLDGVGLPGVSGIEQYGMVTSTDLSDATAPYIVNSNLQMFSYNVDSEWNNGNPTARITSGGVFKLGTDIDSATTTGLDFNPQTGALTIGNASYPGSVTVYGTITVEGGSSGYANFSDRPTTLNSINASEYTKINSGLDASGNLITKVLPGSTVGTPGGAGLFLGSDKMGYYNGSRWLTYMDNTGAFTFSSATSAKLAWDGTDLYGTDGTNTQWYARASTGKFYAGNGAVVLDRTGILVANDGTSAGITLHRTNAFSSSTKSGRLWALSDLSPARVYFSAGRSVSNDGDASSAAGIMDLVAYNSSGTATAMLSLNGSSSTINVTGDLDMGGNDIIDANNVISIRTTA